MSFRDFEYEEFTGNLNDIIKAIIIDNNYFVNKSKTKFKEEVCIKINNRFHVLSFITSNVEYRLKEVCYEDSIDHTHVYKLIHDEENVKEQINKILETYLDDDEYYKVNKFDGEYEGDDFIIVDTEYEAKLRELCERKVEDNLVVNDDDEDLDFNPVV